jgi:succinyl-CoA synthetase beta subunit
MTSRGGMDVETIVRESPSALGEYIVNPHYDIPSHEIIKLGKGTFKSKIEAFSKAGIPISKYPKDVKEIALELLK